MEEAAAYLRVFTNKQENERQRDRIKQWAQVNNTMISKWFEDKHTGSDYESRPDFQNLLLYLESNPRIKRVVFDEVSRMGRDVAEQVLAYKKFSKKAIKVYTVGKGEFGQNKEDFLLFTVLSAISEYEKLTIIDRSSSGKRTVVRYGATQLTTRPYGYRILFTKKKNQVVVKRQSIEINEDEAPMVKKMFQIIDEGGTSVDIQKYLSANNILSPKGYKIWSRSTILGILHNTVYYGKWQFGNIRRNRSRWQKSLNKNQKIIEVSVPAIISKELFERVEKKLTDGKTKFNPKNQKRIYLLKGLAKCQCGRSLRCGYGPKTTPRDYRCPQINREGVYQKTCPISRLKSEFVEKIMLTELKAKIEDPEFFKELKLQKLNGYQSAFKGIQEKIDCLSRKLQNDKKLLKSYYEKSAQLTLDGNEEKCKIYESLADDKLMQMENKKQDLEKLKGELQKAQQGFDGAVIFDDVRKGLEYITVKEIEGLAQSDQIKKLDFVRKYIQEVRLKYLEHETNLFREFIKTFKNMGIFKKENSDFKKLYMTCYSREHQLKRGAMKILEMEVEFVNHYVIKIKFPYYGRTPDISVSYILGNKSKLIPQHLYGELL